MIDKYGQEYWIDFLEADIKVRIHHANLTRASRQWEQLSRTANALQLRLNLAKISLNTIKKKKQEYIADNSVMQGLHVLYSRPLKDSNYDAYITLHARGAIEGHKVVLSGEKGSVILTPESPPTENWVPNDERLAKEMGPWGFSWDKEYKYKMPPTARLDALSESGELRLEIIVR